MNELDITTIKPVSYNRKSSETEDRQVLSIESQISESEKVSASLGMEIGPDHLLTESKSAKTAYNRPIFEIMFHMIDRGEVNTIITWNPDRLSRNSIDAARLIDQMDRGKLIAIITPVQTFRNTPIDKFMFMLQCSQAKMENDKKGVDVKRGQTIKAVKGYPHGRAVIGYLNDRREEKGNRKWIKDKIRFPLVKQLFEMMLSGTYSVSEIHKIAMDKLMLRTIPRKRGDDKPLSLSYIYVVLKNPIYAGFFFYNEKRYELNKSLERIITEEEYWRVQDILGRRGRPRPQKREALYNSLMFYGDERSGICADHKFQIICDCKKKFSYINKEECPCCGTAIVSMNKPKYLTYTYYTSTKAKKDRSQKAYCIEEKKIDKYLVDYFEENFEISRELCNWCIKYLHEIRDKELEDTKNRLNNISQQKESLEKEMKELVRMKIKGQLDDHDYMLMKKELEQAISCCRCDIPTDWLSRAEKKINISTEIVDILKNGTLKDKKACLHELGSNLIMKGKKVNIINTKDVQMFIDGLNNAKLKNQQFEPKNIVDLSDSNPVFVDVRPDLLRWLDTFRTLNWNQIKQDLTFSGISNVFPDLVLQN